MMIIRNADVKLEETPGANFSAGLATPMRGAVDVSIIRQQQRPGGNNPLHYHDREEVLFLRSGALSVKVGNEQVQMTAGDTLIIPAHTEHQLANSGDEIAEWLLIAPRGIRFFRPDGEEVQPAWAQ